MITEYILCYILEVILKTLSKHEQCQKGKWENQIEIEEVLTISDNKQIVKNPPHIMGIIH